MRNVYLLSVETPGEKVLLSNNSPIQYGELVVELAYYFGSLVPVVEELLKEKFGSFAFNGDQKFFVQPVRKGGLLISLDGKERIHTLGLVFAESETGQLIYSRFGPQSLAETNVQMKRGLIQHIGLTTEARNFGIEYYSNEHLMVSIQRTSKTEELVGHSKVVLPSGWMAVVENYKNKPWSLPQDTYTIWFDENGKMLPLYYKEGTWRKLPSKQIEYFEDLILNIFDDADYYDVKVKKNSLQPATQPKENKLETAMKMVRQGVLAALLRFSSSLSKIKSQKKTEGNAPVANHTLEAKPAHEPKDETLPEGITMLPEGTTLQQVVDLISAPPEYASVEEFNEDMCGRLQQLETVEADLLNILHGTTSLHQLTNLELISFGINIENAKPPEKIQAGYTSHFLQPLNEKYQTVWRRYQQVCEKFRGLQESSVNSPRRAAVAANDNPHPSQFIAANENTLQSPQPPDQPT